MYKRIIYIILLIILVIFQISFLNNFNFFNRYINLIVIIIVYLTLIFGEKTGLIVGLTCGIALDLFSPFIFGWQTISLVSSVFIISEFFKKFLARKSTISLIFLILIFVFLYNFFLIFLSYLAYWLNLSEINLILNKQYFNYLIGNLIFNTIFVVLVHYIIKFVKNIVKKRFIIHSL